MDSLELNKDTETGNEIPKKPARKTSKKKGNETLTPTTVSIISKPVETTPTSLESVEEIQSPLDEKAVIEKPADSTPVAQAINYSNLSKAELVNALKDIVNKDIADNKEEVETIKQLFYKKAKIETDELKKQWAIENGDESTFIAPQDGLEVELKNLLADYKAQKASLTAKLEKEKEENLLQKRHILEQMKSLSESKDDVSVHITDFRTLQQQWKAIGQVPQSANNELWKHYNNYQEAFWDLVKINNEFREYDFKKNLEAKTLICESAEKIAADNDIISAFQHLQQLHEDWHITGPVAREFREPLWTRFKDASTVINKKHQSHFDSIRKLEEDNYSSKILLCEKIETIDLSKISNYKEWDEATKLMLVCQEEWRTIGFAPKKVNQKIFERYRKACDAFFAAKTTFYKESKNVLTQNLEAKKELCEKAEALKESTDWKEASDKFIQLQKEWKTIGPVAKKFSDDIWKRFIAACDYFFENKNKSTSGVRNEENENLEKKKALIAKIEGFKKTANASESVAALRALTAEWNAIGHVPFKEKDKIYKVYREIVDKQFEALNVEVSQRRMDTFKNNLKDISSQGENKLIHERQKMMRAYEHLKSEIATYENNIGFFTSSSKKGGGLIKEMERKIEVLKEESKLIEMKINLLDEKL